MPTSQVADQTLQCAACGDHFVFSAGEQELYLLRGVAKAPEQCPHCARSRFAARRLESVAR